MNFVHCGQCQRAFDLDRDGGCPACRALVTNSSAPAADPVTRALAAADALLSALADATAEQRTTIRAAWLARSPSFIGAGDAWTTTAQRALPSISSAWSRTALTTIATTVVRSGRRRLRDTAQHVYRSLTARA